MDVSCASWSEVKDQERVSKRGPPEAQTGTQGFPVNALEKREESRDGEKNSMLNRIIDKY